MKKYDENIETFLEILKTCKNKKGDLLNLTYIISKILKDTYTKNGKMRVYGCGMDMLFDTCYRLNCAIQHYKKGKYDHDKAYHGWVDTQYDLL